MRINVLTELRQPVGTVTTYDIAQDRTSLEGLKLERIVGIARLIRTNRGLLVKVEAKGIERKACARCLKEAECDVDVTFEEEYVPIIDANTGARLRSDVSPDLFRIPEDFVLDLTEGVRQYLLMSEPAKPLCRADCAGLCSKCGADLNTEPCSCPESSGGRWHALAGIKLDQPGGN